MTDQGIMTVNVCLWQVAEGGGLGVVAILFPRYNKWKKIELVKFVGKDVLSIRPALIGG